MSDSDDLIPEGRRLLAAATNGPWDVDVHSHIEKGCRCLYCHVPTLTTTTNMLDCQDVPASDAYRPEGCEQSGYTWDDASLIVWARNNLPALLDEVDSLRATLAAIKAADPALFDPTGGTNRGRVYQTYGSEGEELREAYCAAIGVNLNDYDGDGDE